MEARDEAADLKANPLPPEPNCSTCLHCYTGDAECELRDAVGADRNACDYLPDPDHDESLPLLEQAYRVAAMIRKDQEVLKGHQVRYDKLLERILAEDLQAQGDYSLVDKKRTVRVPSVEKFKAQFPQEYAVLKRESYDVQMKKLDDLLLQDLVSLPVKRTEELIGKVKLDAITEQKVYHNYSVAKAGDGGAL